MSMPEDGPIGFNHFSDGSTRPVFLDHDGRQYVIHDGRPVHGIWLDQDRQDPADAVDLVPSIPDGGPR